MDKKKSLLNKISYGLIVLMVISLLLSFKAIAEPVAKAVGASVDYVTDLAKTVFFSALGLYLISTGVAALAVPAIAVALIAIGAVLIGYALWPYIRPKPQLKAGEKPDNTRLY